MCDCRIGLDVSAADLVKVLSQYTVEDPGKGITVTELQRFLDGRTPAVATATRTAKLPAASPAPAPKGNPTVSLSRT